MKLRHFTSAFIAALVFAILPQSSRAITYADWIASYGLSGDAAAYAADPDVDGLPNLIEYALDTGSPIVNSGLQPAAPVYGRVKRTGNALGAWEWVGTGNASGGLSGVFHSSLRWRPRPGTEGIRYQPEISPDLYAWYSGRSAVLNESIPGNIVQSTAIMQGNRFARYFMRLRIVVAPEVGDSLAGIRVGGISAQGLDVGNPIASPRVIVPGSVSYLTDQDRNVTRSTSSTTISDFSWEWAPQPHNLEPVTLTRESSDPAVIIPDPSNPYRWTAVSNGSAMLTLRTGSSTYTASVTVATLTAQANDTVTGFVSGSLRAHLIAQIDPLLEGKTPATALPLFTTQDHGAGTYVRNAQCWAAPHAQALTAISPWNSQGGAHLAGILVSPRHVLFATHYAAGAGATIRFVTTGNVVVTRTITATAPLPGYVPYYPDLTVGVLDSDVPETISFAKILPADWASKLPALNTTEPRLPSIGLDQEEKGLVSDLFGITSGAGQGGAMVSFIRPASSLRSAFYEDKIGGDSSNPACLIINGQLVVLTCWTGGGGGSGTSVVYHRSALETLMTSLGGGYSLTPIDLSSFPSY